jgi:HD-GYP domain-containing protein (c-di-GMP phosphodiesterase class II)
VESLPRSQVRLAELLGALSLGADLGLGQPMEHVLRQCLIVLRLAERLELSRPERGSAYYVALLAWVGCHVDAYEQARWFGDDVALKADSRRADGVGPGFVLRHVGAGKPWFERARLHVAFLGDGRQAAEAMMENHWRAADALAAELGLGRDVREGLSQVFERWDGTGVPGRVRGDGISIAARLVSLADLVEVFFHAGGVEAAVSVARQRSGTQLDPALVDVFCREAPDLFGSLESTLTWDAAIAAEPALGAPLSEARSDAAFRAVANFIDLKSPFTLGHSVCVAELAADAARGYGLGEPEVTQVWRAGLLHDLGRLGVSNAIWDKRGPLTPAEQERVRLHPYLTERMLASSPALAPLGALAVQHHERLDGSGYPRGLSAESLGPASRILATADTYHAKLEPRPHRRELSPDEVASYLQAEVRAGRFERSAVDAVLRAAGHRLRRRRAWPAGLTAREVDVLRLAARGLTTQEIAERLVISPKTAGNHVEHIYAKIGVSNRARASLFAIQHGLLAAGRAAEDEENSS